MPHSVSVEIYENSHPTNSAAGSAEHVSPTRHHCLRTICRTARTERKFSRRQQFFVFFNSNPSFEAGSRRHRRHRHRRRHCRCFEKKRNITRKSFSTKMRRSSLLLVGSICCLALVQSAPAFDDEEKARGESLHPTVFLRRFRKAGTKATCFGPRNCIELNEFQILKFILLKIFSSLTAVPAAFPPMILLPVAFEVTKGT